MVTTDGATAGAILPPRESSVAGNDSCKTQIYNSRPPTSGPSVGTHRTTTRPDRRPIHLSYVIGDRRSDPDTIRAVAPTSLLKRVTSEPQKAFQKLQKTLKRADDSTMRFVACGQVMFSTTWIVGKVTLNRKASAWL